MHRSATLRRSALRRDVGVLASFAIAVALAAQFAGPDAHAQVSPEAGPLLQAGNLKYIGAFRLPAPTGAGEQNTFEYGGGAMAYDPYRESLWITGHDWHDRLAEVTIPTPSPTDPPVASFQTSWIDMTWREAVLGGRINVGGILPLPGGDLILSAYAYYDASAEQVMSHVRRRANGSISRLTRIGTGSADGVRYAAGFVSGWMLPVPAEWQPLLGAPALTGNGSLSIISRTSLGPALATFDPAAVGASGVAASTQLLAYPITHPTLGSCETGRIFNCAASDRRAGMVWVHGTRTLLYVHQQCEGEVRYVGAYFCTIPHVTKVLAYDANDLLTVKASARRPWDVLPYATWTLGAPLSGSRVAALAYDPTRQWIFMAEAEGDGAQPLIHVYRVDAVMPAFPPPPSLLPSPEAVDSAASVRRSAAYAGGSSRFASPRASGLDEGDDEEEDDVPQEPDARARRTRASLGGRTVPPAFCADANPYPNRDGVIGVCVEGEWKLVAGVRASGVLRRGRLGKSGEVWLIESEGTTYQIANALDETYQEDGLAIAFEGVVTTRVPRRWPGAVVIDLLQLSILPR